MKRVLITGMGTQLGARVAQLLEDRDEVNTIVGFDSDPPRPRLRRAEFHRIPADNAERVAKLVAEVEPDTLLHLGVFEPGGRWPSPVAERRTLRSTRVVFDAAVDAGSVQHVVVRSGIEVYGPSGRKPPPDEAAPVHATTPFARALVRVEEASRVFDCPVTTLRMAPIVGPHGPSPLARYLRLPVVPIPGVGLARFTLLHPEDAAAAVVAASSRATSGVVNVAAPGAVSVFGAVRAGGRVPLPILGPKWSPGWLVARQITDMVGAPLPEHVLELLRHGRTAHAAAAQRRLGVSPRYDTQEIIRAVQTWSGMPV